MTSLESQVTKFSSIINAKSFANRCNKAHLIVLGDDGKFWVATPKITEQLVKSGYEYAK
jgi:hypothetical protein